MRATGEIGIRKALGATDWRIQRDVILRGLRVAIAGIFVGGIASLGFARVLQGMLHGVSSFDAVAFAAAAGLLAISALIACWLPARRAARVVPMQALRQD